MNVDDPLVERDAVPGDRRRDASKGPVPLVLVPGVQRSARQHGVSARGNPADSSRVGASVASSAATLRLLAFELAILGFSRESSLLLAPGLLLSLASFRLLLGRLLRSLGGLLLRAQLLLLGLGTRTRGSGGRPGQRGDVGEEERTIHNGKRANAP